MATEAREQPADGPISGGMGPISAHRPRSRDAVDHAVAAVARGQHGLITLEQLRGAGLSESAVRKRCDAGRLHRVHQRVYAVGHALLTRKGEFMAAVLACGPGAVLSHRSAAELWGLREDRRGSIDVTASRRRGRAPAGIAAHRDGTVRLVDRTVVHGIPCTTVARTLLDFAGVVPVWELRRAVTDAEVLRVLDKSAVRGLIKRSRGRRGVARLRLLLEEIDPATKWTRSEMERCFLRMCRQADLPQPEVNVSIDVGNGHLKPDFLWRQAGFILEADSRRYHDTDSAFLNDRRREQRLQLSGWRVSRCTWAQIEHEPRVLAETIRGLLAQASSR